MKADQLKQTHNDFLFVLSHALLHGCQLSFGCTKNSGLDVFLCAQILLFVLFKLVVSLLNQKTGLSSENRYYLAILLNLSLSFLFGLLQSLGLPFPSIVDLLCSTLFRG